MLNIKRVADLARALLIQRELVRHERLGPVDLALHQERRVTALVKHAVNNSAFYRQHYEGLRTERAIDIKNLPTTTRRGYRNALASPR